MRQINEIPFKSEEHVQHLNKRTLSLNFPKLYVDSLHVVGYVYRSYSNDDYLSLQIGFSPSESNLSVCMTEVLLPEQHLEVMQSEKLCQPVQELVFRDPSKDDNMP